MNKELSKNDFTTFQALCRKWVNKLGITDWEIAYSFGTPEEVYAQTYWHLGGKIANITLNKQWDNTIKFSRRQLDRVALHEVLHVALAELESCAQARYTTEDQLDGATHSFIRRMENIIIHEK